MKDITIAIILAIIDIVSFAITKYLYIHKAISLYWLIVPFLLYGSQIIIFYYGLQLSSMLRLNIVWNLLSSILVALVGIFIFKETISHMKGIALIFGIMSIILFSLSDN
jgi:hypothetical protein